MPRRALPLVLLATVGLAACRSAAPQPLLPPGAECFALDGTPLWPPPLEPELRAERERALAQARAAHEAAPDDADAWVWLGRRMGYLGRYRDALALFHAGEARFPSDPRFPRHVGHRRITLRRFAAAERALERAADRIVERPDEIEPAGLPNAAGIEIDWLHHSIWYHLALARFLQGDWPGAEQAWQTCLEVSRNDDARCSAGHWLYVTLRRQGKHAAAQALLERFSPGMDIVEYHAYHRLLLLYRGELEAEELLAEARAAGGIELATLAFGVAHWQRVEGHAERARQLFEEIVATDAWPAFGYIASEVELARPDRGSRSAPAR